MAQHVLKPGRDVIDSLSALGVALGYVVELERPLPGSTAAIDIAWLRDRSDAAPLFAFEIESRPSEGLANNAMKVLGRSTATGAKPLHLFHVVVRGGLKSRRPVDAAREFAGHNYTVHLLAGRDEPARLLDTILHAHRRLATAIDGFAIGSALRAPLWSGLPASALMQLVDDAGFGGLRGHPIVALALQDAEFRPTLIRHLLDTWSDVFSGERQPPNRYFEAVGHRYATYGSYMAEAACEGLELGLIASLSPSHAAPAFGALQGWQEANHIGDSLGPFSGSGVQWTQYAVGHLGYYWALLAALFAEVPGARRWCAIQPCKLLRALRPEPFVERALLGVWVLHALTDDANEWWQAASEAIHAVGGIAPSWLARPGPASPEPEFAEEEEWAALAPGDATALVPTHDQLRHLVRAHGSEPGDPVVLALEALLEDPGARPADGAMLVAYLARLAPPPA